MAHSLPVKRSHRQADPAPQPPKDTVRCTSVASAEGGEEERRNGGLESEARTNRRQSAPTTVLLGRACIGKGGKKGKGRPSSSGKDKCVDI